MKFLEMTPRQRAVMIAFIDERIKQEKQNAQKAKKGRRRH
jgi:hypothetical protein